MSPLLWIPLAVVGLLVVLVALTCLLGFMRTYRVVSGPRRTPYAPERAYTVQVKRGWQVVSEQHIGHWDRNFEDKVATAVSEAEDRVAFMRAVEVTR